MTGTHQGSRQTRVPENLCERKRPDVLRSGVGLLEGMYICNAYVMVVRSIVHAAAESTAAAAPSSRSAAGSSVTCELTRWRAEIICVWVLFFCQGKHCIPIHRNQASVTSLRRDIQPTHDFSSAPAYDDCTAYAFVHTRGDLRFLRTCRGQKKSHRNPHASTRGTPAETRLSDGSNRIYVCRFVGRPFLSTEQNHPYCLSSILERQTAL